MLDRFYVDAKTRFGRMYEISQQAAARSAAFAKSTAIAGTHLGVKAIPVPLGDRNREYLAQWLTGELPQQIVYTSGPDLSDMQNSPGAAMMRRQFQAANGQNVRVNYGTGRAFWETGVKGRLSSTAFEVGGFGGATAVNNGNGTATFTITNVSGANSFFYHILPDRSSPTGPMHNVTQTFIWTEPVSGGDNGP